jgi:hypothetical protein
MAGRPKGALNKARVKLVVSPERAAELGNLLRWGADADIWFNSCDYRDGKRLRPTPSPENERKAHALRAAMTEVGDLLRRRSDEQERS